MQLQRKTYIVIAATVLSLSVTFVKANKTVDQTQYVAKSLGWVKTGGHCNLCDGYFYQPKDLVLHPHPLAADKLPTNITAKGPSSFEAGGVSKLTGGVLVTQPGRHITADTAYLYRNVKTNKIKAIKLIGHVHLQAYQKLIVAPYAYINLVNHTMHMKDVLYHIGPMNKQWVYHAWGRSADVNTPTQQIYNFKNASYTTCSPLNPVWVISGRSLHFDRNKGFGNAKHVVLRIKNIPVAYIPYFRFPIDNRRLTGFLAPSVVHSSRSGLDIDLPYYWSMAPNYDMTITPRYMVKRGFEISDLFRYITPSSDGKLDLNYLPYDDAFKHYRADNIRDYANNSDYDDYISQMRDMHNYRGFFAYNGKTQWDKQWQSNVHLNYVTDPYYFRDLGTPIPLTQPNQLLNQIEAKYSGQHWTFLSLVQGYQTLHRIDEFDNPVFDQYQRLPEFDATALYPDVWHDLSTHLSTQAVNFGYESRFPTVNNDLPTPVGQRFHMRPGFDYDKMWGSGYIDPQFYLDSTSYNTHFDKTNQSGSRGTFDETRVVPITGVDAGLFLDRKFQFDKAHYIQTLEPRVFYLYVPYEKQDKYPDFDTELLPFSNSQVFSLNRYTGFDRLDNANQLGLGMTSRIVDGDTGEEKLRAQLGVIYYMEDPRVTLPGVTLQHEMFSPLVGSLRYDINHQWSLNSNLAWDGHNKQVNNGGADLMFSNKMDEIFDFGYQFVHAEGVDELGYTKSTDEIHAGMMWPLFYHWHGFGYAGYNFSGEYPQAYFAGVQYDSCCWALRFIFNRHFSGRSPSSVPGHVMNQYDNVYYFQFLLKGLGAVGDNSPTAMLAAALPGYSDPFAKTK